MCGIVGIISNQNVVERLIDGLSRLEYRGYDSAGIATINNAEIARRRAPGKLQVLREKVNAKPIYGNIGIGHTRWATHGSPEKHNAHPHVTERMAVVHNGIIENYQELKNKLIASGIVFDSETDTEVVLHLIDQELKKGLHPTNAVQNTLGKLHGAFALAIIFKDYPDLIIGARRGSPLVMGVKEDELFLGSDAWALAPWTQRVCYLEEGDLVVLEKQQSQYVYTIYDEQNKQVERHVKTINIAVGAASKGTYSHYMLKEIFEQPQTLSDTILSLVNEEDYSLRDFVEIDFSKFSKIRLVACGSSYYVSLLGKYWIEKYARIACEVDLASEFRYRDPVLTKDELCIFVSQSGETSDTLAALNLSKEMGRKTLTVVNVPESSMVRAADYNIFTKAGPEIGVASTKAFSAQMTVLLAIALKAADQCQTISKELLKDHLHDFLHVPLAVTNVLKDVSIFDTIGLSLAQVRDVLFIGRGTNYPVALEGALKLKEISYIHAEAYAAGELKHGPIALVDKVTPLVAIVPQDDWFEKTVSNIQEVASRGAPVIALTNQDISKNLPGSHQIVVLENTSSIANGFIFTVAVQCLAYYTALHKGTDVDQPRNLAKSVTVE
jgi:glucosamine--fructose-6-phosphate aminotransferase (isomerizing)